MAWDVMVSDTFIGSHISRTSDETGEAAKLVAANKNTKFAYLSSINISFYLSKVGSVEVDLLAIHAKIVQSSGPIC